MKHPVDKEVAYNARLPGQSPKVHDFVFNPVHCCPPFLEGVSIVLVVCPDPQVLLQVVQADHLQSTGKNK